MHAELDARPVLTTAQILSYHTDGYLVVEGVFSDQECDQAIAMYERYALQPTYPGIMNFYRGEIEYKVVVDGKEVVKKMLVHPNDTAFEMSLVDRYPIVDMLDTLQNAEVGLLQTMMLFKKAGSAYAEQSWNPHQDNSYPQARWGAYITGNICFTDQDPENGCLRMYPGSHLEPVLPCEPVVSFHETPGDRPGNCILEVPPHYTPVDLPIKKGSVLFLHGNVIHDSYPNRDHYRSRQMLLIPYITKGADFIPGRTAKRAFTPLRNRRRALS